MADGAEGTGKRCLPAGVAAGVLDEVVEVVAKEVLAGVVDGVDPIVNTAAGPEIEGISVECRVQARDQSVWLMVMHHFLAK